jgi:hypothetical protein
MLKTSFVVPSPNRQKQELRQGAHAPHGSAIRPWPSGKIMATVNTGGWLTFAHITVTSFGGTSAASILWPTACCSSKSAPARSRTAAETMPAGDHIDRPWVSSVWGTITSAQSLSAPSSNRPDYDTFGGSLCTSSGHSSSTSSRISSETSVRLSVSSRNWCSRSKSSCTMMVSEIIRGA